jgi:hypothetical protein
MYALADAGACCSQSTYLVDPAWARAIRERVTDRFVLDSRRVSNAQKIIADESVEQRFATTAQSEQKESCRDGIEETAASKTRPMSRGWQNGG